jgi:hypothetical protein
MGNSEPPLPRPTIGALKQCLQQNHGCTIERKPLFRGSDNEDGPMLVRMNGPRGFVPNVDEYRDDEEATPSIVDYFCRRLGLEPADVAINGPSGIVSIRPPTTPQLH